MYQNKANHIAMLIASGHLGEAFGQTRALVSPADAEYTHRIDGLYEAYRSSLTYYVQGVNDPERGRIVAWLGTELLGIALELEDRALRASSPAHYYTRSLNIVRIEDALRRLPHGSEAVHEADAERLLEAVWTARSLSSTEQEMLLAVDDVYLQSLILAGILLALDYYPLEAHVSYLIAVLSRYGEVPELRARAVVGLIIASAYSWMPIYAPRLETSLDELLASDTRLADDIIQTTLQIYRSRGTEELNEQAREQIRASWEQIRPEIRERLGRISSESDLASLEEPEWLSALEESGMQDSMQRVGEMMIEGHDMLFGHFAQLKAHPHFRYLSAWFVPLSLSNPLLRRMEDRIPGLSTTLPRLLHSMCDSDRYSMLTVIEGIPGGANVNAMLQHMQGESAESELDPFTERMRSYVNGLYRFYRLYDRRREHTDIFALDIVRPTAPLLGSLYHSAAMLRPLADVHCAQRRYAEAEACYRMLTILEPTVATHYERLAWTLIESQQWRDALAQLTTAEIIAGERPELIRQMAHCHYQLGEYETTIQLLRGLVASGRQAKPAPLLLRIATAHIALGQWQQALETGFEYELTQEENKRSRRIIALSLLYLGRTLEAEGYYTQLLAEAEPSESDLLNAAHTALLLGKYTDALGLYGRAYRGTTPELFARLWEREQVMLTTLGIEPERAQAIPEYLAL